MRKVGDFVLKLSDRLEMKQVQNAIWKYKMNIIQHFCYKKQK